MVSRMHDILGLQWWFYFYKIEPYGIVSSKCLSFGGYIKDWRYIEWPLIIQFPSKDTDLYSRSNCGSETK